MSGHTGGKKHLLSIIVLLFGILPLLTLARIPDTTPNSVVSSSVNDLVSDIGHSRKSIIVSIYSILQPSLTSAASLNANNPVLSALIKAQQRGVVVTLLLNSFDESNYRNNHILQSREKKWCRQFNMTCYWNASAFNNSHQKIVIIDSHISYILTGNFPWCWASSLCAVNYAYRTTNPTTTRYLMQLYYADFWNSRHHARYTPKPIPSSLVVSPVNSAKTISKFIRTTQQELDIEQPFLTKSTHIPQQVLLSLQSSLDRGINVKIITSVPLSQKHPQLNVDLKKLQSQYPYLQIRLSPSYRFVHAKVLLQDDSRLLIGSINWSDSSFYYNREVGIIVNNKTAAHKFADGFSQLWKKSHKMV